MGTQSYWANVISRCQQGYRIAPSTADPLETLFQFSFTCFAMPWFRFNFEMDC